MTETNVSSRKTPVPPIRRRPGEKNAAAALAAAACLTATAPAPVKAVPLVSKKAVAALTIYAVRETLRGPFVPQASAANCVHGNPRKLRGPIRIGV